MTDSHPNIESFEKEMAEIETLVENSRARVRSGEVLDLTDMTGRIASLCQGVREAALALADPDRLRIRLEDIVHNLQRLEQEIIAHADSTPPDRDQEGQ